MKQHDTNKITFGEYMNSIYEEGSMRLKSSYHNEQDNERIQKLIDITFQIAMTSANYMQGKSNEEIAQMGSYST